MADPISSIALGIAGVKDGFGIATSIRDLVKQPKIDANEVSSQLLLLQQVMLDTQKALNEAADEVRELRARLDRRAALEADKVWEPDGKFYRRKSDVAAERSIAYCPICWETADAAIPMTTGISAPGLYKCGLHDPQYTTNEYREHIKRRDERARQANASRGPQWG